MTYDEFEDVILEAWDKFFIELEKEGLDYDRVFEALNRKDCFNDVFDAVISCVKLESEDD